jgi:hypothetical protein
MLFSNRSAVKKSERIVWGSSSIMMWWRVVEFEVLLRDRVVASP